MSITELCQQIQDCYIIGVDDDGNIIEILDTERMFGLHLTIIVDLAERVHKLEIERNALIQQRQGKYASNKIS